MSFVLSVLLVFVEGSVAKDAQCGGVAHLHEVLNNFAGFGSVQLRGWVLEAESHAVLVFVHLEELHVHLDLLGDF